MSIFDLPAISALRCRSFSRISCLFSMASLAAAFEPLPLALLLFAVVLLLKFEAELEEEAAADDELSAPDVGLGLDVVVCILESCESWVFEVFEFELESFR